MKKIMILACCILPLYTMPDTSVEPCIVIQEKKLFSDYYYDIVSYCAHVIKNAAFIVFQKCEHVEERAQRRLL